MDKYEDLGLEASKFIEDLNMYEASRDGLFRMRRDAGNNPDFEETRRVFASKMTKIHMQKQQEEMAMSSQLVKMNGGPSSAHPIRDRPPINSRQPGEAAAKPPILSGPAPGGQQAALQPELPASRVYNHGNNYDNKELEMHSFPRHPVSPPAAWTPSRESKTPPVLVVSGSSASPRQPQLAQAPSTISTSPSPARVWPAEPSDPTQPTSPLRASTGGPGFHVQPEAQQIPPSNSPTSHNGPVLTSESSDTPQSNVLVTRSAALSPSNVSKTQSPGQSPIPAMAQFFSGEAAGLSSPKNIQTSPQSLLTQPSKQGPSVAEIKLEALTKQLEKEMDAQKKTDYFGKTFTFPSSTK